MTQRKIMFRGLTKYDGWKYGFFVLRKGGHHYIFDPDLFEWWEVLPETVGQYIGECDIKGSEIFTGDTFDYGGGRVFHVELVPGKGFVATFNDGSHNSMIPVCKFEIIGNIHQNKELIKQ